MTTPISTVKAMVLPASLSLFDRPGYRRLRLLHVTGLLLLVGAISSSTPLQSDLIADDVIATSPSQTEISPRVSNGNIALENPIIKSIESISVASEVSGILTNLAITEGDQVKPGDVIAKLRDDEVQLDLAKAKLELDSARRRKDSDIDIRLAVKATAVAETELKRAENANSIVAKTYPQNEIDRYRLVFDKASLEVERAKHERDLLGIKESLAANEVKKMELALSQHLIRSPTSAMVVAIEKRPGEWIEPGTKIAQLTTIDRLRIEGFVTPAQAANELRGRKAKVWVQLGEQEQEIHGEVAFVSTDANPVSRLVRVYLEIANPNGSLRPGLQVRAEIFDDPTLKSVDIR